MASGQRDAWWLAGKGHSDRKWNDFVTGVARSAFLVYEDLGNVTCDDSLTLTDMNLTNARAWPRSNTTAYSSHEINKFELRKKRTKPSIHPLGGGANSVWILVVS